MRSDRTKPLQRHTFRPSGRSEFYCHVVLVAYSLGVDHRTVQMIPFIDLDRCRPLPITPDGTPNLGKCPP